VRRQNQPRRPLPILFAPLVILLDPFAIIRTVGTHRTRLHDHARRGIKQILTRSWYWNVCRSGKPAEGKDIRSFSSCTENRHHGETSSWDQVQPPEWSEFERGWATQQLLRYQRSCIRTWLSVAEWKWERWLYRCKIFSFADCTNPADV
jgi:hypothetical protein